MAESFPVLPEPDFLSPTLRKYLKEISSQVGRHFCFADKGKTNMPEAAAGVSTAPDWPAAAILVDVSSINPLTYSPQWHDPIIAHEAIHIQLHADGWPMTGTEDCQNRLLGQAITTVSNWLSDPIVNMRISARGFSMGPNRIREVLDSISILVQNGWSYALSVSEDREAFELYLIRLFVSFSLEPEIPRPILQAFSLAFRNDLPDLFEKAAHYLHLIQHNGFDTPKKFRETTLLCLEAMGMNVSRVQFAAKFYRFTEEEQRVWIMENVGRPDASWER